jgi:hypothetical protein
MRGVASDFAGPAGAGNQSSWISAPERIRVVNRFRQCIGYRLNILGVRIYRDYCQLVARNGTEWEVIGAPRPLPLDLPVDVPELGSDPLLLTAFQYDQQYPGSDLRDVLARRKDFDAALALDSTHVGSL